MGKNSLVKIFELYFKVAVKIPVVINIITAKIDLIDNLGIPQTPCPEVHPFPIFEPKPTKNPANDKTK